MSRKLFCQISPITYRISVTKGRIIRSVVNLFGRAKFAKKKTDEKLPVLLYSHKSLIRRRLGNVRMDLQDNKAVNLSIASPKVSGILIAPGETFSFWKLVGNTTARKGYLEGLQLTATHPTSGIGGGMCQFTNLIHWMVLHSPLEITEHHHHDGVDMFPDYNRQIPFGTGTSIFYNYLDYRFFNPTEETFQLIVYTTQEYLCGELRCTNSFEYSYHIEAEDEHFRKEGTDVYRCGRIYRRITDKRTGNTISRELLRTNHAKVLYDTTNLV